MINQFIYNYLRLFLTLSVITLIHRILILKIDIIHNFGAVYYNPDSINALFQAWWQQYRSAILVGLVSDFIFVFCASFMALVVNLRWMIGPLLILSVFYAANIEHIHYNFSHIRLDTLYIALDPTFVAGSGLTREMILNTFILSAFVFVTYRTSQLAAARYISGITLVIMLVVSLLLPHKMDPLEASWMQTHPLAFSTHSGNENGAHSDFTVNVLDRDKYSPRPPSKKTHNILVVYLEGVSQYSLTNGDMPFLQNLAAQNVSFNRYFGNQLQTSNGLYTSLTGHYPNFISASSPWDTLSADSSAAQKSLPRIFAQRGYHTAFLQSASLSFMNKGQILPKLGFQEVKGREAWSEFHAENGWGIDDLGLFEATLDYIDTLPLNTSWMVSLLTSGTHAPYNVPHTFHPDAPNRLRALKYADSSAKALMQGLRKRGLLENTVVIFTADESREPGGKNNIENEIILNWLPLVVVHPNTRRAHVDWPVGATSFRDIVLLMAGDWTSTDMDALNTPDVPLIFGNFYRSRIFWYDRRENVLYACYTQDFLCARFDDIRDPTQLAGFKPVSVAQEPQMRAIFEKHETGG